MMLELLAFRPSLVSLANVCRLRCCHDTSGRHAAPRCHAAAPLSFVLPVCVDHIARRRLPLSLAHPRDTTVPPTSDELRAWLSRHGRSPATSWAFIVNYAPIFFDELFGTWARRACMRARVCASHAEHPTHTQPRSSSGTSPFTAPTRRKILAPGPRATGWLGWPSSTRTKCLLHSRPSCSLLCCATTTT